MHNLWAVSDDLVSNVSILPIIMICQPVCSRLFEVSLAFSLVLLLEMPSLPNPIIAFWFFVLPVGKVYV